MEQEVERERGAGCERALSRYPSFTFQHSASSRNQQKGGESYDKPFRRKGESPARLSLPPGLNPDSLEIGAPSPRDCRATLTRTAAATATTIFHLRLCTTLRCLIMAEATTWRGHGESQPPDRSGCGHGAWGRGRSQARRGDWRKGVTCAQG